MTIDGVISRIERTAAGTIVSLESGETIRLGDDETVAFPKAQRGVGA
jgi:hypothetical protein